MPSDRRSSTAISLTTGDDYNAWRHELDRKVRKELGEAGACSRASGRPSSGSPRIPAGRWNCCRPPKCSRARGCNGLGLNYVLDNADCAAFYRDLVREGTRCGYAVMTALATRDEVVATLLGIRTGSRWIMIRISNAGEKWAACSPGPADHRPDHRRALHKVGVREFDFSIGNYSYKRRFGPQRTAAGRSRRPLSWRGQPYALRDRAVLALRHYPKLSTRLKQALGKSRPSREDD